MSATNSSSSLGDSSDEEHLASTGMRISSSDDEEELGTRHQHLTDENTPFFVGSLRDYSYGHHEPPVILEGEEVSEPMMVLMDTTREEEEEQDGPSMPRNDSFLSTSTALTEVSQYDLDTGTRIASMERRGRWPFSRNNNNGMMMAMGANDGISRYNSHPTPPPLRTSYNRYNHQNNHSFGLSSIKKSSSSPHMGSLLSYGTAAAPFQKKQLHPTEAVPSAIAKEEKQPPPHSTMTLNGVDAAAKDTNKKKSSSSWFNNKIILATVLVILVAAVTTAVILVWKQHQHEAMTSTDDDTVVLDDQRKLVFTVSLSATVKLLAAVGLGAIAASKKPSPKASHVILDQVAVSALSRLVFWVFQPSFFFCRVATTIAATTKHGSSQGISRSSLALMPLVALMQITIGSCTAKLVTFFSHRTTNNMSKEERTTVENSKRDAQVCMTFANSGPLPLLFANALFAGGQGGVEADVTACISFYLLGWSPTFWSYGRYLVGTYYSGDDDDSGRSNNYNESPSNACERLWNGIKDFGEQVKKVFAPPIIGSTLGIFVGAIPWLRDSMLETNGILYPLYGAMDTLGSAYLPSVILVLAGSLVGGSKKGKNATSKSPKSAAAALNITTLISILLSRFALAPVASIAVVYILTHVNLLPPVGTRTHAIVSFVMLMEGCMPPAQNSILMLQLEGLKARAENMARTITLIYVLSVLPVTIWLMCMMGMSGVMEFR